MRILLDTNVVLDVLLKREPHWIASANVFAQVETSVHVGLLCATTITTLHYLLGKELTPANSNRAINTLMSLFEIAAVNRNIIESALAGKMPDFEDAVLAHAGHRAAADFIITRNLKDFKRSPLPSFSPTQWLATHSRA